MLSKEELETLSHKGEEALKEYNLMIQEEKEKTLYYSKVATIISSQVNNHEVFTFDTDGTTAITDNSAKVHIFNDKRIFVGELIPIGSNIRVATIRGTDHKPEAIGTARVYWKDDKGNSHQYDLMKALYFPKIPVNIISITSLEDQLNDNEGTYIPPKWKYSVFFWEEEKEN
eukprot:10150694-Ditylum_brightwellii.AAC.1